MVNFILSGSSTVSAFNNAVYSFYLKSFRQKENISFSVYFMLYYSFCCYILRIIRYEIQEDD